VAGSQSKEDMQQLLKGVWLSEGHVRARRVKRLKSQGASTWLRIVLCEGKNREIRRMLARLNHKVLRLRRTAVGPVEMGALPSGKARRLTAPELAALRRSAEHRARDKDTGREEDTETGRQEEQVKR
jgi:23S rRNA pseudouridine2605 synthase